MLETMDIPFVNPSGLSINEEIYQEYHLFVYGSPLQYFPGQRWKNVADGHWTKGGSYWQESGIRGEYWILGVNYNGKEVHNHLFPVDIEPPTDPTQWRYANIADALESWQDAEKYMDDSQKEYLFSQNLMRNQVTYAIKIKDIGLEKVRLENYPTWKSKGTVYTQRYDRNNKRWAANFMIPAMAADAKLVGYANFEEGMEYHFPKDKTQIIIPIQYGCEAINLTEYAKAEHVKQIESKLYINDKQVDEVCDKAKLAVTKEYRLPVLKEDYQGQNSVTLKVEVQSFLFTKFTTDGALVDSKTYFVVIYFAENEFVLPSGDYHDVNNEIYTEYEELPPPVITSVSVKRIVDNKEKELLKAKETGSAFICAGQTLKIRVRAINSPKTGTLEFDGDSSISVFDSLTKQFEWTEPRKRGKHTLYSSLNQFEEIYQPKVFMECTSDFGNEKIFEITYVIPYQTKQTLHSWSTLREISKDAFAINEDKLFTRISKPYEIVLKVKGATGADTQRVKLDVFERWDTIYNRDLSNYIKEKKSEK